MISQQALFTQMELKLQQAKAAQNEAQMREAISALQALCNVVLDSTASTKNFETFAAPTYASNVPQIVQQTSSPTSEPVKFDDANGSSIFDF